PGPDSDDADNTKPDSPITDAAATHSPEHECRCSTNAPPRRTGADPAGAPAPVRPERTAAPYRGSPADDEQSSFRTGRLASDGVGEFGSASGRGSDGRGAFETLGETGRDGRLRGRGQRARTDGGRRAGRWIAVGVVPAGGERGRGRMREPVGADGVRDTRWAADRYHDLPDRRERSGGQARGAVRRTGRSGHGCAGILGGAEHGGARPASGVRRDRGATAGPAMVAPHVDHAQGWRAREAGLTELLEWIAANDSVYGLGDTRNAVAAEWVRQVDAQGGGWLARLDPALGGAAGAFTCNEDPGVPDPAAVSSAIGDFVSGASIFVFFSGLRDSGAFCGAWPSSSERVRVDGIGLSTRPLVLQTTRDAATPAAGGPVMAAALGGTLVWIDGTDHGAFARGNPPVDVAVVHYLETGEVTLASAPAAPIVTPSPPAEPPRPAGGQS
ncbi:hypothetical protein C6575_30815, partial [Nocardia seriolae]